MWEGPEKGFVDYIRGGDSVPEDSAGWHLLALHGGLHDCVMSLERFQIGGLIIKKLGFDTLSEHVIRDCLNYRGSVLLFGHDPAGGLVEGECVALTRELTDLDHGFAHGGGVLFEGTDAGWVVEDATWHLTVATRTLPGWNGVLIW